MKLFDDYQAVRFPEENLIFITHNEFLYYIYNPKYKRWFRHRGAGNDTITVANYPDISREELASVMGGKLPEKKTDLLRLLGPLQITINDMVTLLEEDYPEYMHDYPIRHPAVKLLQESEITGKSYIALEKLLKDAQSIQLENRLVATQVRELSLAIMGRDICSDEIGIVDGHDSSSYFWIMPVRILDISNTNESDNVVGMDSNEISIEEDDVHQYLTPFLYKYFDDDLEANKRRIEYYEKDNDGNKHPVSIEGFEWYLTHNFFTYESMENILKNIRETIDVLASGKENEFTAEIRKNGGFTANRVFPLDKPVEKGITSEIRTVEVSKDLIIDFYHRFIYRMEYMIRVGKEKGFDMISFMGP